MTVVDASAREIADRLGELMRAAAAQGRTDIAATIQPVMSTLWAQGYGLRAAAETGGAR